MGFDDDPYLRQDRRNHWLAVGGVLLGVVLLGAKVALRCQRDRPRTYAYVDPAQIITGGHAAALEPPPPVEPISADDAAPIEFEIVRGDEHVDIVAGRAVLTGDVRLEITPRPQWTYTSRQLSLTYPSSLHLVERAGEVILGGADVSAQMMIVPTTASTDDALAEMTAFYDRTGMISSRSDVEQPLLGQHAPGRRLDTGAASFEFYAVPAGKGRQLRVMLQAATPAADLAPLRAVLASVSNRPRPPTPEFEVVVTTSDDIDIAPVAVTIGAPFAIGRDRGRLMRRPTVRERRATMEFERAPELIVTVTSTSLPSLVLRSGEVGLQLMSPPMEMPIDALPIDDPRPIKRTFGGTSYDGLAGDLKVGSEGLPSEVFQFQRGGRTFLVTLSAPDGSMAEAEAFAATVIASVR